MAAYRTFSGFSSSIGIFITNFFLVFEAIFTGLYFQNSKDLGIFLIIQSNIIILTVLLVPDVRDSINKEISKEDGENLLILISRVVTMCIMISFNAIVIGLIAGRTINSWFFNSNLTLIAFSLMLLTIPPQILMNYAYTFFDGTGNFTSSAISKVGRGLFRFLTTIAPFFIKISSHNLINFVLFRIISEFFSLFFVLFLLKRRFELVKIGRYMVTGVKIRSLIFIKRYYSLAILNVIVFLQVGIGTSIVGAFLTPSEAALLYYSQLFITNLFSPIIALKDPLVHYFSSNTKDQKEDISSRINKDEMNDSMLMSIKVLYFGTLLVTLLLFQLSPFLVQILSGFKVVNSNIVQILFIGGFISIPSQPAWGKLIADNKEKKLLAIQSITTFLFILIIYPSIYYFELYGYVFSRFGILIFSALIIFFTASPRIIEIILIISKYVFFLSCHIFVLNITLNTLGGPLMLELLLGGLISLISIILASQIFKLEAKLLIELILNLRKRL